MTYLLVTVVSIIFLSSSISSINGAASASTVALGESYLYNTKDAPPVLEHGLGGANFLTSKSPKVVEFYDPRCGACQAFKSNYIEVAKKVQAQKFDVEFYGVSCEAHQSLCSSYGGQSVPRIFAFPNGADSSASGGVEVQKGAGTIYFLSARLLKALRTPEEIASDGEKMLGDMEASKRRLEDDGGASFDRDEDEDADSGEDDDLTEEQSEDEDVASYDADVPGDSEDDDEDASQSDGSLGSQDLQEESTSPLQQVLSNKKYMAQDIVSGDEEASNDSAQGSGEEESNLSEESQDRHKKESSLQEKIQDLQDEVASKERHQQQAKPRQPGGHSGNSPKTVYHRERSEDASNKNSQQGKPDDSDGQKQTMREQLEKEKKQHETSDAWKNTMAHFEKIDEEKGKEKGYHYQKYREAKMGVDRGVAAQKLTGSGQSINEKREARMGAVRDVAAQKRTGSVQSIEEKGEREARMYAKRDVAEQKFGENIKGDSRQKKPSSEDVNYAKSVFPSRGRYEEPASKYGQEHQGSGPIPLASVNQFVSRNGEKYVPPPPPREHLPVGGDVYVPNPFNADSVSANKFQEYVARRKKELERKEKMMHPIKTLMGKKEEPEPKEAEDITYIHKKKSPMNNYKAQIKTDHMRTASRGPRPPDLRPEMQHKIFGAKVLGKIPIVKRAFKRSKGEETLNDAALSFTRGLLMGVFKSTHSLDHKRRVALVDWFDLLRVSLPPELGLHELIDTLKYNIDSVGESRENLLLVIDKHPLPNRQWSDSCTKGKSGGGFFCGFWKLLHVMSIGFAEQAGGLALQESNPSVRIFSAHEAGDVVREYMAHFFNCDKCSKRFIGQYDDCSFERCRRLSSETVDAPAESWQEFPLWLWQVHNDISRSKSNRAMEFHENAGRKAEAKKWESDMNAIFPHVDQCIQCVTSAGTWKLSEIYNYLEKEYWTFGHEVDPKVEKFLDYHDIESRNVSYGLGTYLMLAVIMLSGVYAKKRRIRASGRHKKVEDPLSNGFSKKYRDS